MEENGEIREILEQLEGKELAYVMARRQLFSNLKAAEKAGLTNNWWYSLTAERQAELNIFADRLRRADAKAVIASKVLNDAIENAVRVLTDSLDNRDARVRLDASKEVIKRVLGDPPTVVKTSGDVNLHVIYDKVENDKTM
jgi:fructose-1-phosphate kinase PfkB-like protein